MAREGAERLPSMAALVLGVLGDLSEGVAEHLIVEQRVVPESPGALGGTEDEALGLSLERQRLPFPSVKHSHAHVVGRASRRSKD